MKKFSIGAIFGEASALMRTNRWQKIWQYLFITFILGIASFFIFGRGAILGSLLVLYVITLWQLSYTTKGTFSYNDVFENLSTKDTVYFIFSILLMWVKIIGGFILLIIPGIVFAVQLVFVPLISVEKKLSPKVALRESKRITNGNRWKIFWFLVVSGLINLLGLICLVVGLLYTVPLTKLALGILYKKLSTATE